jgi:hypothetical protein
VCVCVCVCVCVSKMSDGRTRKYRSKKARYLYGGRERRLLRLFANPKERLQHEERRDVQNDAENLRNWPW